MEITPPVILIFPTVSIAILSWLSMLLVLNRFRCACPSKIELLSFLLFLLSAIGAWIAERCLLEENLLAIQIVASLYRSLITWFGLLLLVNGRLVVTSQQLYSGFLTVITNLLWEWQHRIVIL